MMERKGENKAEKGDKKGTKEGSLIEELNVGEWMTQLWERNLLIYKAI